MNAPPQGHKPPRQRGPLAWVLLPGLLALLVAALPVPLAAADSHDGARTGALPTAGESHDGHQAPGTADPAVTETPAAEPPGDVHEGHESHKAPAATDAAGSSHEATGGGHGSSGPAPQRPRAEVLAGFIAMNAVILLTALVLRRRTRRGPLPIRGSARTPVSATI